MNRPQYEKRLGNIYTPDWVANLMLSGIYSEKPLNAKVADLGCGDGAFMAAIVRYVVAEAKAQGKPVRWIKNVLQTKIFGFDVSLEAIAAAKERLDFVAAENGLPAVAWQLHCQDVTSVAFRDSWADTFDACIGNPPYVRVQNLDQSVRDNLKLLPTTTGATDLYLAFIYISHHIVKPRGNVCVITPSSYLGSQSAKAFRTWLAESACITEVWDFRNKQVFPDATTYTCITNLKKSAKASRFGYKVWDDATESFVLQREVTSVDWASGPLALTSADAAQEVEAEMAKLPALKDVATINYGLATLADAYYMGVVLKETENTVTLKTRAGTVEVEKAATKKIIKASTYQGKDKGKAFRIVFPYERIGQKHVLVNEVRFRQQWPLAYAYLESIKDVLLARDKGTHPADKWYAFGRTQGLDTTFGPKILTSPINKAPGFFVAEDPDTCYISGYGVKANCDLHALCAQLNSDRMAKFISAVSRDYREGWRAYHKTFIKDFPVDWEALERLNQKAA